MKVLPGEITVREKGNAAELFTSLIPSKRYATGNAVRPVRRKEGRVNGGSGTRSHLSLNTRYHGTFLEQYGALPTPLAFLPQMRNKTYN